MTDYIEDISNNCTEGDYLMLDVPGVFQFCTSFHGMDQVVGTYLGVKEDKVYLRDNLGKEMCVPDEWVDIEGYNKFNREDIQSKEPSNLDQLKTLDLVVLEHDDRQTIGFYQCFDGKTVDISNCRRGGYDQSAENLEVPIGDITGYKVLEKFVPDTSNALDEVLISNDILEAPPGYYD
jgi:hypothetical protein